MSKHSYETHPHLYKSLTEQVGDVTIHRMTYIGKTKTKQEPRCFWIKDEPVRTVRQTKKRTLKAGTKQAQTNDLVQQHPNTTRKDMLVIICNALGVSAACASTMYSKAKRTVQ